MPQPFTVGRVCLTVTALFTAFGSLAADWSETHVFNPNWPPHARFHNGQTMSMGVGLGALTLYYTWRSTSRPADSLMTAALMGCLYFVTALSAIFYPGAGGADPEWGEGFPQFWPFLIFAVLPWAGYLLA